MSFFSIFFVDQNIFQDTVMLMQLSEQLFPLIVNAYTYKGTWYFCKNNLVSLSINSFQEILFKAKNLLTRATIYIKH